MLAFNLCFHWPTHDIYPNVLNLTEGIKNHKNNNNNNNNNKNLNTNISQAAGSGHVRIAYVCPIYLALFTTNQTKIESNKIKSNFLTKFIL